MRKPARPSAPEADPATVRAAIRAHLPAAVVELARLARETTSEAARVSAINALIDRGYGDLRHLPEVDEVAAGITVRFVEPAPKP